MQNLENGMKALGIELPQDRLVLFEKYYKQLIEWNTRFNLTAITLWEEVVEKHFLDSVAGAAYFPAGAKVADVDSGAGFPAIPLKIVRGDIEITMLDSLQKRVGFLKDTLALLGISGEAVHIRAEDAGRGAMREEFDVATARAVAQVKKLSEYMLPLVRVGGRLVLYKGYEVDAEVDEARALIGQLGGKVKSINKFILADKLPRSIIVIDKVSPTPAAFPRRIIK